jgi:glycosyltransferase involved in cell wall biosynthesis
MNERSGADAGRRIAIFHFKGDFDTVPALRSTVILLLRHGCAVDIIYVHDPAFLPPQFESAAVTLVALRRLPRRGLPASLRRIVEALLWLFQAFRHCVGRSYVCLIGVDPVGLIVSGLLAILLRAPLAYFSLELYLSKEITSLHIRLMKTLERFFNRQCIFTIIQDQERARLLADENRLSLEKVILLPNSPLGPARRNPSDYLQKKLGLPIEQRVILYAGALAEWTYTPELIQAARQWPDAWTLVIHSRQQGDELGLDLADFPWVRSSGGPMPYAELPALISSADVGLVLYRNANTIWQGDNMTYVGLSSGKLAQYLRYGVPVAVIAFPGLCELIERYHCGICVKEVTELQEAIASILAHYQDYSQGALACFSEVFDFERHFDAVLARLNSMATIP